MRWIKQHNYRNCGQIAVAVLAEVPLKQVESLFGHHHSSYTRELVSALRELGFECPDRRKAVRKWPAEDFFGIVHIRAKGDQRGGHFVAIAKGKAWDGCATRSMKFSEWIEKELSAGWRITAILPVEKS